MPRPRRSRAAAHSRARARATSGDYAAAPEPLSGKVFKLDPDELSRDIHRVQTYALTAESAGDANLSSPWATNLAKCATRSQGTGTFVPVRYGGRPAVVAFRMPAGDTQVAEVYLCGGAEPVRSLTLPIP